MNLFDCIQEDDKHDKKTIIKDMGNVKIIKKDDSFYMELINGRKWRVGNFHGPYDYEEFVKYFGKTKANVISFSRILKEGDIVVYGLSDMLSSYADKKRHNKEGIIVSLSSNKESAHVKFNNDENDVSYLFAEKIISLNGERVNPALYEGINFDEEYLEFENIASSFNKEK
jgi:hypothetical protein